MTTATVASPAFASTNAPAAWHEIPTLAAHLLWRHWPQLLFWFFAQRVAYQWGLKLSIALTSQSPLLGYVGISLLVLVQLITTAMMFIALKPSLPNASGRLPGDALPPLQPWATSLSAALLPFFAFYVTWGFLENVKRDFGLNFFDQDLANAINTAIKPGGDPSEHENWRDVMQLKGVWIAVMVAGVVRYLAKRRAAATGRLGWTLLATACEAYWVFIGVTVIASVAGDFKQIWQTTRIYQAVTGWWENPFVFHLSLQGLKQLLDPVMAFIGTVTKAALLPLVWLAITAIIYGLDLRKRQRIDHADSSLGTLADEYKHSHFLVRRVVGKFSGGWDSKGVPVVNSIRLVLRGGLPALLTLCVGWELLSFLDAWGWRAAVHLIGPMEQDTWHNVAGAVGMLIGDPTTLQPSLFAQVLRTVLLAATFDRAMARLLIAGPGARH